MVTLPVNVMAAAPPINSPSVIVVVPVTDKSAKLGCSVPSVIVKFPLTVISASASSQVIISSVASLAIVRLLKE